LLIRDVPDNRTDSGKQVPPSFAARNCIKFTTEMQLQTGVCLLFATVASQAQCQLARVFATVAEQLTLEFWAVALRVADSCCKAECLVRVRDLRRSHA
jgi:hypothetical protein